MRPRTIRSMAAAVVLMASSLAAVAVPITYNFAYVNGAARATGSVTFESTLLPNPGSQFFTLPNPAVLDIKMDVSGAAAGNGHFTTANFTGVIWNTGGVTLNLFAPLGPQGTWLATGDLNFFGAAPTPSGVAPFTLAANGGASTAMTLTFASPLLGTPTLGEWALIVLALVLAGAGIVAMRRGKIA